MSQKARKSVKSLISLKNRSIEGKSLIYIKIVTSIIVVMITAYILQIMYFKEVVSTTSKAIESTLKPIKQVRFNEKRKVYEPRKRSNIKEINLKSSDQILLDKFELAAKRCNYWRLEYIKEPIKENQAKKIKYCKIMKNILR